MSKSPAFQFYPADWLSSQTITLMAPEHEGAYIRLLCFDWAQDGIPDDDTLLSRLSRLNEGWFNGGSIVVKKCFTPHPQKPGFLTNSRLQIEREKQKKWSEKSTEGGKKSAETRAKKAQLKGGSKMVEPKGNRTVEPKGNSSSSSMSSSSNDPPISPKGIGGEFLEEWNRVAKLHGLPGCLSLNKARLGALNARMSEPIFQKGWREALRLACENPWNLGENDRGWKADVDWFLRPGTVLKIMERQSAPSAPKPKPGTDDPMRGYEI